MRRCALLCALTLFACRIDEDNFSEKYARVFCDQQKKCNRGDYDSAFSDRRDCIETTEEFVDDVIDLFEVFECEIDSKGARDLLQAMRRASCEEWVEGDFETDDDMFVCPG